MNKCQYDELCIQKAGHFLRNWEKKNPDDNSVPVNIINKSYISNIIMREWHISYNTFVWWIHLMLKLIRSSPSSAKLTFNQSDNFKPKQQNLKSSQMFENEYYKNITRILQLWFHFKISAPTVRTENLFPKEINSFQLF